jgi:hypothetical protein
MAAFHTGAFVCVIVMLGAMAVQSVILPDLRHPDFAEASWTKAHSMVAQTGAITPVRMHVEPKCPNALYAVFYLFVCFFICSFVCLFVR